jgi:hypothetical protein
MFHFNIKVMNDVIPRLSFGIPRHVLFLTVVTGAWLFNDIVPRRELI